MKKHINIGIVGIGNIGTAHAHCIADGKVSGMQLAAICDIAGDRREYCKNMFPDIEVYSDYSMMLADDNLDAVIISVPHRLHADMAIMALESGKHILVEKPVDITVSKAIGLNDIAQKSEKVFAIMFNQRTNKLFAKAREIVKNGDLGELKRMVWIITNWYRTQSYYDSGDWRATWSGEGGGVLLNQAPHNLDIWQWICGMPQSITAFCDVGKYHHIETEDDVTILARYKNGATGTFITSTGEYPGTNRLEISGSKGKIVLENDVLKYWKLKQNEREICYTSQEAFANIDFDYSEIAFDEPESAHRGILQNFTNAILFGEELISPGIEGVNELTLSNAAYLSSWNNNCEVKIPFDCKEFDKKMSLLKNSSKFSSRISENGNNSDYSERWRVHW